MAPTPILARAFAYGSDRSISSSTTRVYPRSLHRRSEEGSLSGPAIAGVVVTAIALVSIAAFILVKLFSASKARAPIQSPGRRRERRHRHGPSRGRHGRPGHHRASGRHYRRQGHVDPWQIWADARASRRRPRERRRTRKYRDHHRRRSHDRHGRETGCGHRHEHGRREHKHRSRRAGRRYHQHYAEPLGDEMTSMYPASVSGTSVAWPQGPGLGTRMAYPPPAAGVYEQTLYGLPHRAPYPVGPAGPAGVWDEEPIIVSGHGHPTTGTDGTTPIVVGRRGSSDKIDNNEVEHENHNNNNHNNNDPFATPPVSSKKNSSKQEGHVADVIVSPASPTASATALPPRRPPSPAPAAPEPPLPAAAIVASRVRDWVREIPSRVEGRVRNPSTHHPMIPPKILASEDVVVVDKAGNMPSLSGRREVLDSASRHRSESRTWMTDSIPPKAHVTLGGGRTQHESSDQISEVLGEIPIQDYIPPVRSPAILVDSTLSCTSGSEIPYPDSTFEHGASRPFNTWSRHASSVHPAHILAGEHMFCASSHSRRPSDSRFSRHQYTHQYSHPTRSETGYEPSPISQGQPPSSHDHFPITVFGRPPAANKPSNALQHQERGRKLRRHTPEAKNCELFND